jgi:hypothetical protein
LQYEGGPALPSQPRDLKRLHLLITKFRSTTVLEFGCGYSTFVIAQALQENKAWFDSLPNKPKVRNANMFKCFSVDTNLNWIDECKSKLPPELDKTVGFCYSPCSATLYNGQMGHFYRNLPDIVPDFIYLDGPDPEQIDGSVNGLSWQCPERTPISIDLLFMESTMLPGTAILIDGRTNNARFLARNFRRKWKITSDIEKDYTLMVLNEPALGKIVTNGRDILEWLGRQQGKKK